MPDDLDGRIDEMFFDDLFQTLTMAEGDARVAFDRRIAELAWSELQRAISSSATTDARRFKAISDAERMFGVCLKKNFPDATALPETTDGAPA